MVGRCGTTRPVSFAGVVSDGAYSSLAYRWAPIHYQDSASSKYTADYLAPIDYDGDWNTLNWENLDANVSRLVGTVYYSVVETSTHWFITYAFFHPRDWKLLGPHENDMVPG